jgi:hypothetical protein
MSISYIFTYIHGGAPWFLETRCDRTAAGTCPGPALGRLPLPSLSLLATVMDTRQRRRNYQGYIGMQVPGKRSVDCDTSRWGRHGEPRDRRSVVTRWRRSSWRPGSTKQRGKERAWMRRSDWWGGAHMAWSVRERGRGRRATGRPASGSACQRQQPRSARWRVLAHGPTCHRQRQHADGELTEWEHKSVAVHHKITVIPL